MTSCLKKLTYSVFVIGFLVQGNYGLQLSIEDDDISVRPCFDPNNNIFDLIKIYEQNSKNTFHNVKVIPGTNLFKTALHFEEGIKMYIEGDKFPGGIPREFSFECIFRTEQPPIERWCLFYLANDENKSLMQLVIDPISKTIDFFLPKSDGEMEIVSFEGPKIFDGSWHIVMLRLINDSVDMWVDCERVLDLEGREEVRLEHEQIDDSDGSLTLAVGVSSENTISIDIQQMIVSSEAKRPDKTTCKELPELIAKLTEEDKTANETCPKQCPAGPPGQDGLPGLPGSEGLPGLDGYIGIPGAKGEKGFANKGEQGQKGEQGDDGRPGYRGPYGVKGEPGNPGMRGETGDYGLPGINGKPGRPGLQGLPAPAVDQSELENLCISYVQDYIKEHQSELVGPPGRDGFMGIPGQPGQKGETGYQGIPGLNGYPGLKGKIGPRGPAGEPGVCPVCDY